jgi:hypothetical protein
LCFLDAWTARLQRFLRHAALEFGGAAECRQFSIGELAVKLLHVAWIKSSMADASLIDRNSPVSSA